MKPDRARNARDSKSESKRIKITQPRKGLGFCEAPNLFHLSLFATMSLSMFQCPTFSNVESPGVRAYARNDFEIIGMIGGAGFPVKIELDSYAASKVADRYT